MPIKIPDDLPAKKQLENENIFVMTTKRALSQDIRPLKILIFNLMPTKIVTETQLSRLLSNSPLQCEITFMTTKSYDAKNTPKQHMVAFYETFDKVKDKNYDGMIITGAPVETLPFEEVNYWEELCEIMEWTKTHVHSTFHICWGAQAALYYHYGVDKHELPEKMFGIFEHKVNRKLNKMTRGFDEYFMAPHSRHTGIDKEILKNVPTAKIIATSKEAGVFLMSTNRGRQIYVFGHPEYDADTLSLEYFRDVNRGLDIKVPKNYFPGDDPSKPPRVTWRAHASLLFSNWLNYYVYQSTPYDINNI